MKKLKKNKKMVMAVLLLVFFVGIVSFIYFGNRKEENVEIGSFWESEISRDESKGGFISDNDIEDKDTEEKDSGSLEVSDDGVKSKEEIYIHIVGEVRNEGIIILKEGQRIVDAIEKAGGVTELADLSRVNLAYVLSDGQMVRIPSINDTEEELAYVTDGSGNNVIIDGKNAGNNGKHKVNINTATQTELETLNGIGPSLATRIIEYRDKNGKFKSVDELMNVSGIGDSKLEEIRDSIELK